MRAEGREGSQKKQHADECAPLLQVSKQPTKRSYYECASRQGLAEARMHARHRVSDGALMSAAVTASMRQFKSACAGARV